ncbi:ABC transporter permease [Azospirillum thiophilum]|uniref:ABC transporter permease n=1 Tax=Azospirillum thiophilum TaxID=528244 RepID=A0AAC9EYF3_9PROT|nr:ABC transporter permease [Azospirillum thiophilum]ALG74559.1 ABC transporter permease [Azospirillum thiophilum]KJR61734.1 ABC transporter permease [Azospirillum thiophilum]
MIALLPRVDRDRRVALLLSGPAGLILLALFALPLALLFAVSLQAPPGGPPGGGPGLSLAAYERLLTTPHHLGAVWNSLKLSLAVTIITLLVGYPASFAIARAKGGWRSLMLGCLFLPLAASVIVKAFAWTILLRSSGVINTVLLGLGIVDAPVRMIFTETALIVGAVNVFLPFMILPVFAVVAQLDPRLSEAAATLGANPVAGFLKVTLPVTMPGIVAGVALVSSLSVSAYVVPTLLIGERYPTLASTIAKAYLLSREPAFGAAAGVVLLVIAVAIVVLSSRVSGRVGREGRA